MNGLTLAAWVLVAGSILAIVAAFLISNLQHRSTLKVLQTQHQQATVKRLEVLFALGEHTRTLIEKANAGIQEDFRSYRARESDSNDLLGLHEALVAVVLHELPTGNTVFAILRLREVSREMPRLVQQAADDLSEYGGVS
ncbi:MAG: hypothetical protein ACRECQ_08220, partial [Burkholderiaceae bacterium]